MGFITALEEADPIREMRHCDVLCGTFAVSNSEKYSLVSLVEVTWSLV